ncbi:putative transporter [Frondihabitans sp. 762G35]|nr:putative transporter [Frondihabitans sp. 762G35]
MTTRGGLLARRLTLGDATAIGLGSMIGAGVFAAFTPAARAAGPLLLVGLVVAAFVAYCNATSSAQLAARYPTSGGTYVYGRERLGEWPGFVAGWSFVIGKTASCAAMALTVAAALVPAAWQKPVAVLALLSMAALNWFGITRTARLTRVIVVVVLVVLGVAVVAALAGQHRGWGAGGAGGSSAAGSVPGILQAAGFLFFAFAGYARVATLGEEVIDPRRTIPRAILLALAITVVVYGVVGVVLLVVVGADGIAHTATPLVDAVAAGRFAALAPIVRAGAALAALGALLALLAGVSRTTLAMARNRDLPGWLGPVHPVHRVPHHAEIAVAVAASVLVLTVDLRGAIGFSSFGVLLYYLVANASALTQGPRDRRYPRVLPIAGIAGCAVLVIALPPASIVGGVLVVAIGIGYRLVSGKRA